MTARIEAASSEAAAPARGWLAQAGARIGRQRILVVAALAAFAMAAAANWSWLVALGIAPVLLALAPCAVMCALRLCKGRDESCSRDGASGSKEPDDVGLTNRQSRR